LHVIERVILVAISALGLLYLAILATFTWASLRQKLVDHVYSFQLSVSGLPSIPAPTTGTATVTSMGGLDGVITPGTVTVNVSGLSDSTMALVITSHVVGFLLYSVLISSVIYLCLRLFWGKPFARSMTTAAVVVSLALIILGTGSDLLTEFLRAAIQEEALGTGMPPEPYSGGSSFSFPGGYLMAGLAVAALALAFRIGERAQRDTEGLV
jgi:hypothetical protein